MVPHKTNPNIKVDIWHPVVGLRYIILPRDLSQLKARIIPFDLNPRGKELCLTLAIFNVIFIAPPKKSKYKSWYLTPFFGLEVQNPPPSPQALKSVKGPGNTFELNPKWERILPSFGNFSWNIHRVPHPPNPYIKVDIWHPAVGLRCKISPRDLSQFKALEIPLN